ncbi:unnamed protein product, partial [Candidula unifasciata]
MNKCYGMFFFFFLEMSSSDSINNAHFGITRAENAKHVAPATHSPAVCTRSLLICYRQFVHVPYLFVTGS